MNYIIGYDKTLVVLTAKYIISTGIYSNSNADLKDTKKVIRDGGISIFNKMLKTLIVNFFIEEAIKRFLIDLNHNITLYISKKLLNELITTYIITELIDSIDDYNKKLYGLESKERKLTPYFLLFHESHLVLESILDVTTPWYICAILKPWIGYFKKYDRTEVCNNIRNDMFSDSVISFCHTFLNEFFIYNMTTKIVQFTLSAFCCTEKDIAIAQALTKIVIFHSTIQLFKLFYKDDFRDYTKNYNRNLSSSYFINKVAELLPN